MSMLFHRVVSVARFYRLMNSEIDRGIPDDVLEKYTSCITFSPEDEQGSSAKPAHPWPFSRPDTMGCWCWARALALAEHGELSGS